MKQPLTFYPSPILRQKCAPVIEITDEIRTLVKDLKDTMLAANGIGISAPQLGCPIAVCFTCYPIEDAAGNYTTAPPKLYINPRLSKPSSEYWSHDEGCLSLPKIFAPVDRPIAITVTALDIDGNEFTEELDGWAARVIMHENDHLNGVLFIDRLSPRDKRRVEATLRQLKKQYG